MLVMVRRILMLLSIGWLQLQSGQYSATRGGGGLHSKIP